MGVGRKRKRAPRRKDGRVYDYAVAKERGPDLGTPEQQARRAALYGHARAQGELSGPLAKIIRSLTQEQARAASLFLDAHARYRIAISAPALVCAPMRDFIEGSKSDGMSDEARIKAVDSYARLVNAVARHSRKAAIALRDWAGLGSTRNLASLRVALSVIADELLTQREAA